MKKGLKGLRALALKAAAATNMKLIENAKDKVLMLRMDPAVRSVDVTICWTGHKDFTHLKFRSDIVIDLTANKILKNRFAATKKEKAK